MAPLGADGATDEFFCDQGNAEFDSDNGSLDAEAWGCDPTKLRAPREGEFLKKLVDPKLPTEFEWEQHCLMGHIPYRNCCPVCVRAQGRDAQHQSDKGEERLLPEYIWDYLFSG